MAAKYQGPLAPEQAQIITPPQLRSTVGICADMRLVFAKRRVVHYNCSSPLWSSLILFQKACNLFSCNFANLSCSVIFFLIVQLGNLLAEDCMI